MGLAKTQANLTWGSSATTKSIAATSTTTSDAVSISDNAISGVLLVKTNSGKATPTAADTVTVKILYSNGDIPGTPTGNEFADKVNAPTVLVLSPLTGSDPDVQAVRVNTGYKYFQVCCINNSASTNVVSARYSEQTASDPA